MAGDEDRAAILLGKHGAGVETHAERGRMRPELGDRRLEVAARASPAEFIVGDVALVTVRKPEMLARPGDAVEFVVGQFLR